MYRARKFSFEFSCSIEFVVSTFSTNVKFINSLVCLHENTVYAWCTRTKWSNRVRVGGKQDVYIKTLSFYDSTWTSPHMHSVRKRWYMHRRLMTKNSYQLLPAVLWHHLTCIYIYIDTIFIVHSSLYCAYKYVYRVNEKNLKPILFVSS